MKQIFFLLVEAQKGNPDAEAKLVCKFEPLINKLSYQQGIIDEDCKQHLTIEFILAVRRFDLNRYYKKNKA